MSFESIVHDGIAYLFTYFDSHRNIPRTPFFTEKVYKKGNMRRYINRMTIVITKHTQIVQVIVHVVVVVVVVEIVIVAVVLVGSE